MAFDNKHKYQNQRASNTHKSNCRPHSRCNLSAAKCKENRTPLLILQTKEQQSENAQNYHRCRKPKPSTRTVSPLPLTPPRRTARHEPHPTSRDVYRCSPCRRTSPAPFSPAHPGFSNPISYSFDRNLCLSPSWISDVCSFSAVFRKNQTGREEIIAKRT
jgi:hypothetical protein